MYFTRCETTVPSPFEGHQIIKQRTKSSSTRRSLQIIHISICSSCTGNIVPSYPKVHSICINHFPVPKEGINDRLIYINKLDCFYNDRLRSSQPASAKFCNKVGICFHLCLSYYMWYINNSRLQEYALLDIHCLGHIVQ